MKSNEKLISLYNLKKYFPIRKANPLSKEQFYIKANDGISINIHKGETYGLVGESGCGKSTLGRVLLQLYPQSQGNTYYYGRSIYEFKPTYVHRILSNLTKYKSKLVNAMKKAVDLDYKKEIHSFIKDDADKLYHQIVHLTGALIYADDMSIVSSLLLKEYEAGIEVAKQQLLLKEQPDIRKMSYELAMKKQDNIREELVALKKRIVHEDYEHAEELWDHGIDLGMLNKEEMRRLRQDVQIIFQDPYSSLNPRMSVAQLIQEPLIGHKIFKRNRKELETYTIDILKKCGLDAYFIHRYPHQFSGGQRQRIGIARALALKPKFIVCDEALSSLDVSIQSQILNLLSDLKEKEDLTYLFISHDLSVVKYISDRIGVMYLGNLVESALSDDLFIKPLHPYTQALLNAIPLIDIDHKQLTVLEGDLPSAIDSPKGCKFHPRCQYVMEKCRSEVPTWKEVEPQHFVACHLN